MQTLTVDAIDMDTCGLYTRMNELNVQFFIRQWQLYRTRETLQLTLVIIGLFSHDGVDGCRYPIFCKI